MAIAASSEDLTGSNETNPFFCRPSAMTITAPDFTFLYFLFDSVQWKALTDHR